MLNRRVYVQCQPLARTSSISRRQWGTRKGQINLNLLSTTLKSITGVNHLWAV